MVDYQNHPQWGEVYALFRNDAYTKRSAHNNTEAVLAAWDAWPELKIPATDKPFDADVTADVRFVITDMDTGDTIDDLGCESYNRPSYEALSSDLRSNVVDKRAIRRSPRGPGDHFTPEDSWNEVESSIDLTDYADHGDPELDTIDDFYITRPCGKHEPITLTQFYDCYLANLVATILYGSHSTS